MWLAVRHYKDPCCRKEKLTYMWTRCISFSHFVIIMLSCFESDSRQTLDPINHQNTRLDLIPHCWQLCWIWYNDLHIWKLKDTATLALGLKNFINISYTFYPLFLSVSSVLCHEWQSLYHSVALQSIEEMLGDLIAFSDCLIMITMILAEGTMTVPQCKVDNANHVILSLCIPWNVVLCRFDDFNMKT